MTTCTTPGCPNTPAPKRRVCNRCRSRQDEARQRGQVRATYGPCNVGCPGWARCTSERLWTKDEPLPCEGLLDDEIGAVYDSDSSATVWVMPLEVRVNVEAIG